MNAEIELMLNIKHERHNACEFLDEIITFANLGVAKIGAWVVKT